jgi:hypothetical protein
MWVRNPAEVNISDNDVVGRSLQVGQRDQPTCRNKEYAQQQHEADDQGYLDKASFVLFLFRAAGIAFHNCVL